MRVLGGEGQELLTCNKPFPTLRFFFTREGNSFVSQEAACLDLPVGVVSRHCMLLVLVTWASGGAREEGPYRGP